MDNKKPECVENKIKDMIGKQNYKQTIMNYSKIISLELKKNPSKLKLLLDELELDQQTLFDSLINNNENITYYEYVLNLVKDNELTADDEYYPSDSIEIDIQNKK